MRERLDDHSRFLEEQLAILEALVIEKGEIDVVVPAMDEEEHLRSMRSNPPPSQSASAPRIASTTNAVVPPPPSITVGVDTPATDAVPTKVPAVAPLPFQTSSKHDVEEAKPSAPEVKLSATTPAETSKL